MINRNDAVGVTTPAGKRALGVALAKHDPDYLADLQIFAHAFGPAEAVYYRSGRPAVTAAVAADVRQSRHDHFKKE